MRGELTCGDGKRRIDEMSGELVYGYEERGRVEESRI